VIINLKLNLGDGSLSGNASINGDSSFEINYTIIIPNDLNVNPGQALISFNTENGKLVQVRSNVRKEDTDLIQVFTNLDTLVELTKNIPVTMEIP
jgi:hypothetical protein